MARTYRHKGEKTHRASSAYEKKCANRRVRYSARNLQRLEDEEVEFVGRKVGSHIHVYEMGRDYNYLWRTSTTVIDCWVQEMTITPQVAQNYPRLAFYLGRRIPVSVERRFSFDKSLPEGDRSVVNIRKISLETLWRWRDNGATWMLPLLRDL